MENYLTEAITIATAVVTVASAVCAVTPTPDPATWWGKAYRVIEYLGMVVGKAKHDGSLPATPQADKLVGLLKKD